jgi:hypothetical protein
MDFESGIISSFICVGTYHKRDEIMDCTKFEDLIPCSDDSSSGTYACFLVVTKETIPRDIDEAVAFYGATNGAGLNTLSFSNPKL